MSNNKQSSVDAYCNGCNAFICDELVTFEETCSNCGTQIEYFEDKMSNNKQSSVEKVWLILPMIAFAQCFDGKHELVIGWLSKTYSIRWYNTRR